MGGDGGVGVEGEVVDGGGAAAMRWRVGRDERGLRGRERSAEGYPSTEIVSMGLEQFRDPAEMLKSFERDPEHFTFILGVLEALAGR